MMTNWIPRPDQDRAVNALFDFYSTGNTKDRNPLIGMPTGYGKSGVIGMVTERMFRYWPNSRTIVVTPKKELVEQDVEALIKIWPTAPYGINCAGLGYRDTMAPIVFGTIKSLLNNVKALGPRNMVKVDEAHLVSPEQETMYQDFVGELQKFNPYVTLAGWSATLYRTGSGPLEGADGGLFTDVVYDCTTFHEFNRILAEGWLCPLIPKMTQTEFSVEGVDWGTDDYNQKQAQAAVDQDDLTLKCCREIIEYKYVQNRRSCLIFSQGKNHAEHIAKILRALGQRAEVIHEGTHKDLRREYITSFKNGTLPFLVNNDVLTTGFDYPGLDMIAVMRLIGSPGLWVQILGRGTRPLYAPGWPQNTPEQRIAAMMASYKRNCLVLDFGGNGRRLGPINDPMRPRRKGKRNGPPGLAPIKICPNCKTYNHASTFTCDGCGMEFSREQKLTQQASTFQLIKTEEKQFTTYNVKRVLYTKHEREGNLPLLLVTYVGAISAVHKEYIGFEHTKGVRKKAVDWWLAHSDQPIPSSVDSALKMKDELKQPKQIEVWSNTQFPEIARYIWE